MKLMSACQARQIYRLTITDEKLITRAAGGKTVNCRTVEVNTLVRKWIAIRIPREGRGSSFKLTPDGEKIAEALLAGNTVKLRVKLGTQPALIEVFPKDLPLHKGQALQYAVDGRWERGVVTDVNEASAFIERM